MSKIHVLDANAVLDLVEAGPGFGKVETLLQSALRFGSVVLVSAVNWGEVFYQLWQRRGEEKARRTMADLSRLPLQVISVDVPLALKAGEIKAVHKIPYVNCIAAALTLRQQGILVTSDRDFEKLGRNFPILWIARS